MKRVKSLISLALVAAFVFMAIPPTAVYARPKTFDKSRINTATGDLIVHLQISDMIFTGRLTRKELSDEELDKLIKEVLDELGLSEEGFDELKKTIDEGMSQEEKNKIRDAATKFVEIIDPTKTGAIGMAAKLNQMLDQLNQGDYSGASESLMDLMRFKDIVRDVKDWKNLIENALGESGPVTKAMKTLANFYSKLSAKIHDKIRNEKWGWKIEFKDAKASKPFSLYGTQCTETWTLNAVYEQKANTADNPYEFFGQYLGPFNIKIDYDLSDFHTNIETAIWNMPEFSTSLDEFLTITTQRKDGSTPWETTVVDHGISEVKRTLSGRGGALILPSHKYVDLWVVEDEKQARVENIAIKMHRDRDDGSTTGYDHFDHTFTATKEFFINHTVMTGGRFGQQYVNGGGDYTAFEGEIRIAWDENIWKRGDNVKLYGREEWYIKLTISYPKDSLL